MTEHEIVPDDEPSMEDYPPGFDDDPTSPGYVPPRDGLIEPDEFGAPPVRVTPVRDGVRDTRSK